MLPYISQHTIYASAAAIIQYNSLLACNALQDCNAIEWQGSSSAHVALSRVPQLEWGMHIYKILNVTLLLLCCVRSIVFRNSSRAEWTMLLYCAVTMLYGFCAWQASSKSANRRTASSKWVSRNLMGCGWGFGSQHLAICSYLWPHLWLRLCLHDQCRTSGHLWPLACHSSAWTFSHSLSDSSQCALFSGRYSACSGVRLGSQVSRSGISSSSRLDCGPCAWTWGSSFGDRLWAMSLW